MQVPDEVVPVLLGQGHEGAPHHDELHLVHRVPQLPELVDPVPGLQEGVIPSPDSPHAGRFIPCVGLGGVLEVRVRSSRAVYADITSKVYMGTSVGLTHHSYHCYTTGCANRLRS